MIIGFQKIKIIILFFVLITLFSCNNSCKKISMSEENENKINIEYYYKYLKIRIDGYYGCWTRPYFEFEINPHNSQRLIINETLNKKIEIYNRILTFDEMKYLYEYILTLDLEKKTEINTFAWTSSHDFSGKIIINIDNITYNKEIFPDQNFDSDLYKLLKYLNSLILSEYYLPIRGVY